jgi:hypothetical protein
LGIGKILLPIQAPTYPNININSLSQNTFGKLIKYSIIDGWVHKQVPNGSDWEFCKQCVDLKLHIEPKK